MYIKSIKLSPKRAGNGLVSSYSINIGSKEAQQCGWIDTPGIPKQLVKVVDADTGEICIKEKKIVITEEVIRRTISLAEEAYPSFSASYSHPVYSGASVIDFSQIQSSENERKLEQYLFSLSFETLTDLITLMYMGRNMDCDMRVDADARFLDYWLYLESGGLFARSKEELVWNLSEKGPLAAYLSKGIEIMHMPPIPTGDQTEDYIEGNEYDGDYDPE